MIDIIIGDKKPHVDQVVVSNKVSDIQKILYVYF